MDKDHVVKIVYSGLKNLISVCNEMFFLGML